jgi:hypothetical protein
MSMSDPQCASGLCTTEDVAISKCHLWGNFVSLLLTEWGTRWRSG